MIKKLSYLLTIFLVLFVSACGQSDEISKMTDMGIKSELKGAERNVEASKKPGETVPVDTISVSEDLYLGDSSVLLDYLNPLPKDFETEYGITLTSREKVGIFQLANQIYYLTGIQTKISNVSESTKAKKISVSYSGTLSGLLNMISNEFGISWEYTGGSISLFTTRTKTFSIYTVPVSTKMSARVKGDSKGDTTISAEADLENWADIENTLKSIVAGDASATINISKATSTVTVTASVDKLKKIEQYIKSVNQRLSRQVSIHVKIVQVSLTDKDQMGLDLKSIFKAGGMKFSTGGAGKGSAGDLNFAIIEKDGALGALDGTTAAIKALSEQYRVSYVTDTTLLTRNGRVFPFNMLREFKYVKSIATSTEDSNSTTDVQTDDISTGLSIQILPNILDNGRLMLMFSMSLRELLSMNQDPTGKVQLPDIDNRTFMNELILQSGQTAVLTGFEKVTNTNKDTGIGKPEFKMLGGDRKTESQKEVLVVILTPYILKSPLHSDKRAGNGSGYTGL